MRSLRTLALAILIGCLTAACNNSTTLNQTQLHTLLHCPCPTIAPLAAYTLPSANTYLSVIVFGPDGNIWVPEFDANKIARVTTTGTITEFAVPTANAAPSTIAAGPDGNLWFTEDNVNTIARITTSGVVTEFPLPPPLDMPPHSVADIVAGPDGNLWFTHSGANIIGVMNTAGVLIHQYPIPTPNSNVFFIIAGPDGNMWFEENDGNNIGRITMTGAITEFPIPTPGSQPRNLVVASDGSMWFPELSAGKLGRITTAGVITDFAAVSYPATERLRRITATPDFIWVAQAETAPPWNSEIAKFDLSGSEADLWSFPGAAPRAVTTGPDGSPWFGDEANDQIVRL